jgi:hypothetical protein
VFLTETSVDIQLRTRQYILEDSELHTRRRENLKSYKRIASYILVNIFLIFFQISANYSNNHTIAVKIQILFKTLLNAVTLVTRSRVSSGSIVSD